MLYGALRNIFYKKFRFLREREELKERQNLGTVVKIHCPVAPDPHI